MLRRQKKTNPADEIPVPNQLPPVEELEEMERQEARQRPHTWLWTLGVALVVAVLVVYVVMLGAWGAYDGLKDRARQSRELALEQYATGEAYLEADNYELAIAAFELALRHDAHWPEAESRLWEAKELAKAQVTPTSEARQDATRMLYEQAIDHYGSVNLDQALAALDELRGLDVEYQRENVEKMLITAHYQLGLRAVREDRLDEASAHFEAVLDLAPDHQDAQDQLNLLNLYTVALNHWEQDWPAAIQALKGLYALVPDYKDVRYRLRDAYLYDAQTYANQGNWCRAYDQYAAAVKVLPLESTVDKRDDAAISCQATAEAPTSTPTRSAAARPTVSATPSPATTAAPDAVTPAPTSPARAAGSGRIAFTSYDATRQRTDIYVMDLAQGDARLLRENASHPSYAPGGRRLAFRNQDPLHLGLGVLDLGGGVLSELTDHVEDSTPDWSPATQQIAFASNKHGDRKWRIYAISHQAMRGEGEEWAYGQMPAWSPDGSQVAYHGCDERGDRCGVWLMLAGGFQPNHLTSNASDTSPAWSPDGSQIAFISARAGNWDLYVVDVATGQEVRLTDHLGADVAPTWSPDGGKLAFLSSREGAWAVYILDVKSGQVQKVIATGDAYPDPVGEQLSWVR